MAAKRIIKQKSNAPGVKYHCRDCAHSYDWRDKALDGHLILCRCKLDAKTNYGRWCKFLCDPACENFKLRKDGEKAES